MATTPVDATPVADAHGSPKASLRDLTRQALADAFHQAAAGASLDWLLCRPELQAAFHAACAEAGLMGSAYEWNRELLKMRKSGALGKASSNGNQGSGKANSHPEARPPKPDASAVYAAEIAWAKVRAKHANASLDDILCDPAKLELFDKSAKQAAPGGEASDYRWEALRLRKAAKTHKAEAKQYEYVVEKAITAFVGDRLKKLTPRSAKQTAGGGVYLITTAKKPAEGLAGYLGAADDLAARLAEHVERKPLRGELYYAAAPDDALPSADYRDALRWNLVHRLKPTLSVDLLDERTTL